MLWQGREGSSNVDDRRGISGKGLAAGGGIIGVIVVLINMFMGGGDVSQLPQVIQQGGSQQEMSSGQQAADEERAQFVKVVLKDTEEIWNKLFAESGSDYPEPTLVLFRGSVQSGCGGASAASGPFYCPADQKLYIDLSFYEDLSRRFGAPGDFAMAYVVSHEVAHHIQTVTGTSEKMARWRQQLDEREYNRRSVMMELQADFLAGVWAHYMKGKTYQGQSIIQEGDIEEALIAANAIGDDRLQKESQGRVVPDAFTHGTSEQRMYWFRKGYQTGDINQGDTFNDPSLQ